MENKTQTSISSKSIIKNYNPIRNPIPSLSNTWFISDTHFNHKNIIEYCDRPFSGVEEMDQEMIQKWNARIAPSDVVYHLGDFCMGETSTIEKIVPLLNGEIHLIKGNHDHKKRLTIYNQQPNIVEIMDLTQVYTDEKIVFVLCHYPITNGELFEQIVENNREIYVIHGHTHDQGYFFDSDLNVFNVCVDHTNFYPINLNELISIIRRFQDVK